MQDEESICPICGSPLVETVIDHNDWNDGHFWVVRAVPVRECEANGHRFFRAQGARSLERVFQADSAGELEPTEMIQVPVVEMAAFAAS